MPVTPVVAATGSGATADGTPANSKTVSATCSGSNRGLVVFIGMDHDAGTIPTALSVTFNSDALTFLGGVNQSTDRWGEWWGMANPDAVTGDLVVTLTGGLSQEFAVGWAALTGVAQTASFSAATTGNGVGNGTSINLAVACDNDSDLVFGGVCTGTSLPSNSGSMQRRFGLAANNAVPTQVACAVADTLPGEGDLSVAFSWPFTPLSAYACVGVAVHAHTGTEVAERMGQVPI